MSYTPPFTTETLAALESAIARGVTSVSYDGNTVSYRNLSDMLKVRDWIRRELGLSSAARAPRPRPRRIVVAR